MEINNATRNDEFEFENGVITITDFDNDVQYTLDADLSDIQIHANNGEEVCTVQSGWDYRTECPAEQERHYSDIEIESADVKSYALANILRWSGAVSIAE